MLWVDIIFNFKGIIFVVFGIYNYGGFVMIFVVWFILGVLIYFMIFILFEFVLVYFVVGVMFLWFWKVVRGGIGGERGWVWIVSGFVMGGYVGNVR